MAIIVEYHVVADMYPLGDQVIKAGQLVKLHTDGTVIPTTQNSDQPVGIAGDSQLSAEGQTTAYSDEVTIGAYGNNTRWTSNRVSDFYKEAAASDKVTVYNGGGKFWTDQYTAASITVGGTLQPSADGKFANGSTVIAAIAAGEPRLYPSGVPGTETGTIGTDLTSGDMAIRNAKTNNYWLPVLMRI